jgi:hypothetical protein
MTPGLSRTATLAFIVLAGLVQARPGHPRLSCNARETWLPGTRPGTTTLVALDTSWHRNLPRSDLPPQERVLPRRISRRRRSTRATASSSRSKTPRLLCQRQFSECAAYCVRAIKRKAAPSKASPEPNRYRDLLGALAATPAKPTQSDQR